MGTKRFKPLSVGDRPGERGRNQDLAAERFAQRFDPGHLVDRGADDCEVKAIDGADIAIEDLTDVQREIDDGNWLPCPCPIGVKSVDALHRFGGGVERAATGLTARRLYEGKAREHAIAKELEHLSPAWAQGGRQRLEDVIESIRTGPGVASAKGVKPRMSAYHNTARILSTEPRSTTPA
jgi:hypothetical protein